MPSLFDISDPRCDQGDVGHWRRRPHQLTAIVVSCEGFGRCGHERLMAIDPAWPDELDIRALRRRLVCQCGLRSPTVRPDWSSTRDPPRAWSFRSYPSYLPSTGRTDDDERA